MKMLKSTLILLTATAFFACQKSGTSGKSCDDYWIAKKKGRMESIVQLQPWIQTLPRKGCIPGYCSLLYQCQLCRLRCNPARIWYDLQRRYDPGRKLERGDGQQDPGHLRGSLDGRPQVFLKQHKLPQVIMHMLYLALEIFIGTGMIRQDRVL